MSTPESKIVITADVTKVSEGFARVEADATRLTGALGKIGKEGFKGLEQSARQGLGGLQNQLSGLTSVVARVTGVLAALGGAGAAFTGLRNVINELDALNDTADATGASIENLSALEGVGRRVGTSFDTISSILVKFNAQLAAAGDPASDAAQALAALGLSAEELRNQDPAIALQRTAQALAGFADDANKARLIQELFGKSVREAAPFLKDLAEAGELSATATREQADAADRLIKNVAALRANFDALARVSLSPLFESLNKAADLVSSLSRNFGSLSDVPLLKATLRAGPFAGRGSDAGISETVQAISKLESDIAIRQRGVERGIAPAAALEEIKRLQADLDNERKLLRFLQDRRETLDPSNAYSNEGRQAGGLPSITPQGRSESATRSVRDGLKTFTANRVRTRDISDNGIRRAAQAYQSDLQDFERRQQDADRFADQLREQSQQINVSLIKSDRERGEAQIDIDRRAMQQRLDVLRLGGVNVEEAQAALNRNIIARQASLTEALKPEWQRMLEGWQDTTEQMAKSYDALMSGVVVRTEDALTEFIKTGKINIDDLANYVQSAVARMLAQQAIAQGAKFASDLISLYSGGFAKGGAFGPGGQITAFAAGGVVDRPTFFGYAGGRKGLMGEAGPEAIMPLTRGPDGKLGVKTHGGSQAVNVTINAQAGVSRSELAAMLPMIREQIKAELQGSMRRPGFAG